MYISTHTYIYTYNYTESEVDINLIAAIKFHNKNNLKIIWLKGYKGLARASVGIKQLQSIKNT